ncbi:MAG: energy-coupling factor ABC transporter ATP-binding protein [Spirochaetota bacterium]
MAGLDSKTGDTIIELRGIKFGYTPERVVFNGLDIMLKKDEKAALTGHNGSGKTTLFHIIMGLVEPWEGTVSVFGNQCKTRQDFYQVRRRVGLLFQDPDDQLFSPTVEEDVAFGPLNLGRTRAQAKKIVFRTLELLGMQGYEKRITYRLSEGEKRLVALATVLAMEPEVLLLDEPVSGLDEQHRERFIQVLQTYNHTCMVISHDQDFLNRVIQRRYVLHNGFICSK